MTDPRIFEKIKKLLALSKSSNEYEAASAASKAAELMLEHQISEAAFDVEDQEAEEIGCFIIGEGKRKVKWKGDLVFGAAAAYGCKYYWRDVLEKGRQVASQMVAVGRQSDMDAVRYTYLYLVNEINRLAEVAWHRNRHFTNESAKGFKSGFRHGAALVVRKRLEESRKEKLDEKMAEDPNSQALVRVANMDRAVEDFFKDLSKNFGKAPGANISSNYGFSKGMQAGENINLGGGPALDGKKEQLDQGTKLLGE